MNLPLHSGSEYAVTGLFEDYFRSFVRIGIGTPLIMKYEGVPCLTICPVNVSHDYVVTNIEKKGFWIFKKTYVTIEKIDKNY